MSNVESIECSNAACNCTITAVIETEGFCSDYCRNADEEEEVDFCACGHPPCDAE